MSAQYSKRLATGGQKQLHERHLQCTGFRCSERMANRDGDHSWAICGMNLGPTIVHRNDIDPLHTEVKDAVIETGNSNLEMAPKLGGVMCRMLRESDEMSKLTSVHFLPMPHPLQLHCSHTSPR